MISCEKHGHTAEINFGYEEKVLGDSPIKDVTLAIFCYKCFVEKLEELGLKNYK